MNMVKNNYFQLQSILSKVRDTLLDERILSVFEISVSGLVPSLLEFIENVHRSPKGVLAKCFAEVFYL